MQLATGRNLDIITEATLKHPFSGLRSSPQNIENGLYLAELTDALLDERQSAPELFDLLLSSLYLLETRPEESLVIRRFELQALALAGYAPETPALRRLPRAPSGRTFRCVLRGARGDRLLPLPQRAGRPDAGRARRCFRRWNESCPCLLTRSAASPSPLATTRIWSASSARTSPTTWSAN